MDSSIPCLSYQVIMGKHAVHFLRKKKQSHPCVATSNRKTTWVHGTANSIRLSLFVGLHITRECSLSMIWGPSNNEIWLATISCSTHKCGFTLSKNENVDLLSFFFYSLDVFLYVIFTFYLLAFYLHFMCFSTFLCFNYVSMSENNVIYGGYSAFILNVITFIFVVIYMCLYYISDRGWITFSSGQVNDKTETHGMIVSQWSGEWSRIAIIMVI